MAEPQKVKCAKIRRPESHGSLWCLVRLAGYSLSDEFDGAEVGETLEIEYCELTEKELSELPDFPGW
jgi:hypothetical protein